MLCASHTSSTSRRDCTPTPFFRDYEASIKGFGGLGRATQKQLSNYYVHIAIHVIRNLYALLHGWGTHLDGGAGLDVMAAQTGWDGPRTVVVHVPCQPPAFGHGRVVPGTEGADVHHALAGKYLVVDRRRKLALGGQGEKEAREINEVLEPTAYILTLECSLETY